MTTVTTQFIHIILISVVTGDSVETEKLANANESNNEHRIIIL